jgi:hypothetical protein
MFERVKTVHAIEGTATVIGLKRKWFRKIERVIRQ